MKYICHILIFFLFVMTSCHDGFHDFLIKNTSKVIITFHGEPVPDKIKKMYPYEITDKATILNVINGITSFSTPWYKCGYDGHIDFYNGSIRLNDEIMEFNLDKSCSHIVFKYKDEFYSRKMSSELVRYLSNKYTEATGPR